MLELIHSAEIPSYRGHQGRLTQDKNTGQVYTHVPGSPLRPVAWAPAPTLVATSRALTQADNGMWLECTATVTLTVPVGLIGFSCSVIPSGTTSIASSGGALLNGATTTLTRAAATAANAIVSIVGRTSAVDSYVVSGS